MTNVIVDKALVSVVVPTYNRADTLIRAIDSILNQSYSAIEVVVVDDGSTDDTNQVVRRAQQQDTRIVLYPNTYNKGCSGARNTGLSVVKGEYIAFLDDDDEYLPDKLLKQCEILSKNPRVDVVVSGVPAKWCQGRSESDWVALEFHPNRIFLGCHLMCRKAVMQRVAFQGEYMEWRDIAFQLYDNGFTVCLSNERLVRVNSSVASLSKQNDAMFYSALTNAKRYHERSRGRQEHPIFTHYLANCHKTCGNHSLKKGGILTAIYHYLNSFRVERKLSNLVPFSG